MSRLDDAIGHLASAVGQSLPTDDQIIIGHVRDALELLRAERDTRKAAALRCRDCGAALPERCRSYRCDGCNLARLGAA